MDTSFVTPEVQMNDFDFSTAFLITANNFNQSQFVITKTIRNGVAPLNTETKTRQESGDTRVNTNTWTRQICP